MMRRFIALIKMTYYLRKATKALDGAYKALKVRDFAEVDRLQLLSEECEKKAKTFDWVLD